MANRVKAEKPELRIVPRKQQSVRDFLTDMLANLDEYYPDAEEIYIIVSRTADRDGACYYNEEGNGLTYERKLWFLKTAERLIFKKEE